MSGNVFNRSKATAIRLIKKYGGPVTIIQQVEVPNEDEPWKPGTNVPKEHPGIMAAFLPTSERQNRKIQLVTGTDVPTGVEVAYIAGLPFQLTIKDTIRRKSGKVYSIIDFDAIDPDENGVIVYEIYVRG